MDNDKNTFEQTEIEEMDARKRLAALKLLQAKEDKLKERKGARGAYWRGLLTEKTTALHEAIDAPEPVNDAQCRVALRTIKGARQASEDAKVAKKAEMDDLKAAIKRIEESMTDLIVKDPSSQVSLEFGTEAPGAWLSTDVATQVNLALSEREARSARGSAPEMNADLEALRADLAAMGLDAIEFSDDDLDDGDDEDDADDDDGEEDSDDDEVDDGDDEDDEPADDTDVEYDEDSNVIDLAGNG